MQALHVSIKASKLNFDWNTYKGPLNKINEELKEVEDELNKKNIVNGNHQCLMLNVPILKIMDMLKQKQLNQQI